MQPLKVLVVNGVDRGVVPDSSLTLALRPDDRDTGEVREVLPLRALVRPDVARDAQGREHECGEDRLGRVEEGEGGDYDNALAHTHRDPEGALRMVKNVLLQGVLVLARGVEATGHHFATHSRPHVEHFIGQDVTLRSGFRLLPCPSHTGG